MAKTRRHEIEGAVLDVPLRYDQRTGRELEEYPDLPAHPVYTPAGERIMLTVEDACRYGETAERLRLKEQRARQRRQEKPRPAAKRKK